LNHEAELLDDNRLDEWLELLDPEIDYSIPIRLTTGRKNGAGFSDEGYHMLEDYPSLATRVKRLESDFAWAEDPPSRARRFVSNVRVTTSAENTQALSVRSNLLIYRGRLDTVEFELISGERQDVLVPVDDGLKLRRRVVLFDHSTLPAKNLALFF
jgi:3-phenylpropionate/cinnamic acid dioxygenase small subunit